MAGVAPTATHAAAEVPRGARLQRFPTRVLAVHRPSHNLVLLRLRFAPPAESRFQAGQWVYVFAPGPDGERRRPYSIANPPTDAGHIELAVKAVNPDGVSGWLYRRERGDAVEVSRALGSFTFRSEPDRTVVLLATGTGVAPLRSMLLERLYAGDNRPFWLFVGSSRPNQLPYHEGLVHLAQSFHNLWYVPTVSRADTFEWTGERGWIEEPFLKRFYHRADFDAYVCGVPAMCREVTELVARQGVPRARIHEEKYV